MKGHNHASNKSASPIENQVADLISHPTSHVPKLTWVPSTELSLRNEHSQLPPPAPYFDRRARVPSPSPQLKTRTLSRTRSLSPSNIPLQELSGNTVRLSASMTTSMPNLYSSRSIHNRAIGHSILRSESDYEGMQERRTLRERLQEFEALLGDL